MTSPVQGEKAEVVGEAMMVKSKKLAIDKINIVQWLLESEELDEEFIEGYYKSEIGLLTRRYVRGGRGSIV